jgi:hypothetical protein
VEEKLCIEYEDRLPVLKDFPVQVRIERHLYSVNDGHYIVFLNVVLSILHMFQAARVKAAVCKAVVGP